LTDRQASLVLSNVVQNIMKERHGMSDMDREGQTHASRLAASENLALTQLETTFEAALAEVHVSAARLNQLEEVWSQKKSRLPDVLVTT
jgi:hypothetical protein